MISLTDGITCSLDLQDRTKELYKECVDDFLAFIGPDPHHWSCASVETWLHYLLTKGRTAAKRKRDRGPCSPHTVRVYRKAIRYASKQYAKGMENDRFDFARNVNKVKAKQAAPREPLTYEEADRLLATCDGASLINIRDRTLITTALRTGLRRGGLLAMTIEAIRPPKITTIDKGGDPLTIDADRDTLEVLREWLMILRKNGVVRGPVFWRIRSGKIVRPMTPFEVWSVFNRRAKQANVRHVFPHLARHSTVTWLREEGKSAAEVSKLTGQTERTIENIYTHIRVKEAVANVLPPLRRR